MLSDQEYLRAIKAAREASADGSIPFELALNTAIESLERKKQEEMAKEAEPAYSRYMEPVNTGALHDFPSDAPNFSASDAVIPSPEEYNEPFGEISQDNYNERFNLDNFMREKYVEANSLFISAVSASDLSTDRIGTRRYVDAARNGAFSSDYMDTVIPTLQNEPQDSNGFGDCVKKLNMIEREIYYAYYAMSSPEEIERERQEAIKMYERLQERGIEAHQWLDVDRAWNHDAATIVVANEISMRDKRAENAGVHEVGVVPFEEGMEMTPGEFSFSPACYDNAYYVLSGRLTKEGDFHNKRMFEEAQVLCDKKLDEIRNMSTEEYREYRISQMRLAEQEKTRFNGDLGLQAEKEAVAGHSK